MKLTSNVFVLLLLVFCARFRHSIKMQSKREKSIYEHAKKKSTQSMKSKHIIEMEEDNAGSSFNSTIVSRKHNISKIQTFDYYYECCK